MKPTRGQQWWRAQIERKAYDRLRQLRMPGAGGAPPLWDGTPPVPVDHLIEHLLCLSICYEELHAPDGALVFGCLRLETGEIVLNEHYRDIFERVPGLLRYTKCHEAGHADLFGAAHDRAQLGFGVKGLERGYQPLPLATSRGGAVALSSSAQAALRACPKEVQVEVVRRLQEMERARWANGEDPPQIRRAVDRYAAHILMPKDVVRAYAAGMDLGSWNAIGQLAELFRVSKSAMRYQLEETEMIHGVDPSTGRILTVRPEDGQMYLL